MWREKRCSYWTELRIRLIGPRSLWCQLEELSICSLLKECERLLKPAPAATQLRPLVSRFCKAAYNLDVTCKPALCYLDLITRIAAEQIVS
jgi:hypothetical protein